MGLREVLRAWKPEILVHGAGLASVPLSLENPGADFFSHVVLTERLVRAVGEEARGCRVVYLSSAAVYGQPEELPVDEGAVVRPISPYGFHKRMAELLIERGVRGGGMEGVSARIFSAYGRGLRRQVVWEAGQQAARSGRVRLGGTGRETRDFIHGRDVARGLRILAERAPGMGEVINVGSGVETSIRRVAEGVVGLVGGGEVEFGGQHRAGDPERWVADVRKLRELGFVAEVSLEEGLCEVVEWARELEGGEGE
jgi:UDP-glucose 4-epimerase